MPQLQVISPTPRQPSFSSQLGSMLGTGIGQGIASGLNDMLKQKENKRALGGLSPFFKQIGLDDNEIDTIVNSGLDPQLAITATVNFAKQKAKTAQETSGNVQGIFNTMSEMLAKDLPGIGISPKTRIGLDPEGSQNRAEFDSLRGGIESALIPLVNKGALSKNRFDYILSLIPNASDRQRAILGKLKGLSKVLAQEGIPLDTSILESIPWAKSGSTKSASSNFVLMKDPKGQIRRIPKDQVNAARKAGGELVK